MKQAKYIAYTKEQATTLLIFLFLIVLSFVIIVIFACNMQKI